MMDSDREQAVEAALTEALHRLPQRRAPARLVARVAAMRW